MMNRWMENFDHGMVGDYCHGIGLGMGWSWIIALIIIGLIVWLVVKETTHNTPTSPINSDSALEVLKKRYARGEINKQDFEEIKKNLS